MKKWIPGLAAAALLLAASPMPAQTAVATTAQPASAGAATQGGVPISFENQTLFTFRARVGVYTPAERAAAAKTRLREVASGGGKLEITADPQPDGNLIRVDGKTVFLIAPGDVDALAGETLASVTARTVRALESAAAAYHEQRDLGFMLKAVALAAIATVLYALILRGIYAARRWLARRVTLVVESRVRRLNKEIATALSPASTGGLVQGALSILAWSLGLFATYLWLTYVLERFPYTRPWGLQLEGFLLDTIGNVALAIAGAFPGLFIVVIIVTLTRVASHVARVFFDRIESGRISVGFIDPFTAPTTRRLVAAFLWLFAFAMAYPYLPGAQTEAFKGLSVLLGLMVSLGASSVVGQTASGLILTYSHAFKPGEYVRIGDSEGTLTGVGMFATRIETGLGVQVVLPNSYVLANTTKNYSRAFPGTGFVMDTAVTIGYATPWRQVHAMLKEAARRTPGIAVDPVPFVAQTALSDFYVEYRLVCYAQPEQPRKRAALLSELHASVQDVFNEHGVQIMSPHYMADPPEAQVVPKAKWFAAPADGPTGERRTS
jgi:small-conductance mechanosensitive channel